MRNLRRVCIVGAGSIGSLYAVHLASVAEVSVLTRRKEHAAALNIEGLQVTGKTARHVKVIADTDPRRLHPDQDLLIVATKASEVEPVARDLAGYFTSSLTMTVQNGLGSEAVVHRHGDWPLLSAVTFMAGTRHTDTLVEYELDKATWLGPWSEGKATYAEARAVEGLLIAAGLRAEAFEDLLPAQWSKLIFNATVNSVSAATNLPVGEEFVRRTSTSDLGHLVSAMMDEGKRVAKARGIPLHLDPWAMLLQVPRDATDLHGAGRIPSMLADVRARRATEIEWITGALIREAAAVNVDVPINTALYLIVKAMEKSWQSRAIL